MICISLLSVEKYRPPIHVYLIQEAQLFDGYSSAHNICVRTFVIIPRNLLQQLFASLLNIGEVNPKCFDRETFSNGLGSVVSASSHRVSLHDFLYMTSFVNNILLNFFYTTSCISNILQINFFGLKAPHQNPFFWWTCFAFPPWITSVSVLDRNTQLELLIPWSWPCLTFKLLKNIIW